MRRAAIRGMIVVLAVAGCTDINSNDAIEPDMFRRHDDVELIPLGGAEWRASEPPPPVTGGHMAALDETTIAFADPDGRELLVYDREASSFRSRHALAGEPGRLIADPMRGVHVVLRDAAAIVSLDVETDQVETRAVCASPRGVGYDAETDSLFVACIDGRVQRLPRTGGEAQTLATLEPGDLRDIVPQPEGLWVTHFRSARVSLLNRDGTRARDDVNIPSIDSERESLVASIAWRAVARPEGGIVIAHQRHTSRTVSTTPVEDPFTGQPSSAYGRGFDPSTGLCHPPLVSSAVTWIDATGVVERTAGSVTNLPVDLAIAPGEEPMIASAALTGAIRSAYVPVFGSGSIELGCGRESPGTEVSGQAVSLVSSGATAIVQTRFPSGLWIGWERVPVGDDSDRDIGHALFHAETSSRLACASCHPEGGEDGVRWSFFGVGARRTQELRGGLLATAPFHWSGDRPTLHDIMDDVFRARMGGGTPTDLQIQAVGEWIDAVPLPVLEHADAAAQGRTVFEREGCADCHAGAQLTNNESADFGRGPFQVPTLLGVSYRGPWMHDGCARTLASTFLSSCAGDDHASASALDEPELGALVAYLRSL